MRWMRRMAFRLRALLGRGGMERELREELDFHLEMETRKHRASGMDPVEARREALRRFGGVDRFRARTRDAWGGRLLEETLGDVRFGVRQLARRPGFALLALATVALGVGTTTALFGVVHPLLLSPLPFEHGERMVAFWQPYDWRAQEYDAIRELELESMDAVAAFTGQDALLQSGGPEGSVVVSAGLVTPGAFDVVGARPLLGRAFSDGEHAPGAGAVAVVSHGLWRQELGGDPDVVGRRIELDGSAVTVVGVMPEGFYFPLPQVRLWRPLELDPGSPVYEGRGWLVMTGRLRPGASEAAVGRDLRRMTDLLGERFEYPEQFDRTRGASVEPLRSHLLGETRPALHLLLGAVGLLLLVACANVTALLLARTCDRAGEIAVRAGMGAGRGRLARQLLTEGAVLGLGGGILGAGAALALHGALAASIPVSGGFEAVLTMPWRVPALAVVLSAALGATLALVPLRAVLRGEPSAGGARASGGTASGQGLQWTLVTAQVTLAVTLVTGATLLVRSVDRLMDVELGLRPEGVTVAEVVAGPRPGAERRAFFLSLVERMEAAAGVEAAGTILRLPLRERGMQGGVWVEDRPALRGTDAPNAYYRTVTPGTFEALGTTLLAGRGFMPADRDDAPQVAVVSRGFAERVWPDGDPVGRRIAPVGFEAELWATVVGVVDDVRYEGPTTEPPPAVYRPVAQAPPWTTSAVLAVRAPGRPPEAVLAALRREAAALDPLAAVHRTSTMEQVLRESIARPLRLRLFLGLFGGLALLLGMVGVYGVVSYAVSRRTREYGVRLAMGADPRRLVRAVVGRGMVPVGLGVAGGVALSLLAGRALATFLFEVPPSDPLSVAVAALLLLAAGVAAATLPALRAGRVDPVEALRAD